MDPRTFDRNADKLAQVLWNVNKIKHLTYMPAQVKQTTLVAMVEYCLQLNDDLGKMSEKGLI